jgi:hypothetical protein
MFPALSFYKPKERRVMGESNLLAWVRVCLCRVQI